MSTVSEGTGLEETLSKHILKARVTTCKYEAANHTII